MKPTLERAANTLSLVSVITANLLLWATVFALILPAPGAR